MKPTPRSGADRGTAMKAKLVMGVKYGNQPKLQHMDFGGKPGATLPAKRITGPRVRQMKAIRGLGGKGK